MNVDKLGIGNYIKMMKDSNILLNINNNNHNEV
jgi:hypothetical protein